MQREWALAIQALSPAPVVFLPALLPVSLPVSLPARRRLVVRLLRLPLLLRHWLLRLLLPCLRRLLNLPWRRRLLRHWLRRLLRHLQLR